MIRFFSYVCGSLLFLSDLSYAAAASKGSLYHFSINKQPLSEALSKVSTLTGRTIFSSSEDTHRVEALPVNGELDVLTALELMLKSSNLIVTFQHDIIILKPKIIKSKIEKKILQSQANNYIEEVIATAQKLNALSSDAVKRDAFNISEHVYLSQTRKLIDTNLADTLTILPGVTISRDSGEGRRVSLRGLEPHLTQTRINGLDALFATDSGVDQRGGADRSRGFDYSIFPADLFNQIELRKSYTAKMGEGSISGTLDLTTLRPMVYGDKRWHGKFNLEAQYNNLSQGYSPSISAHIAKRWNNIAALFSINYSQLETVEQGHHTWHWSRANFGMDNVADTVDINIAEQLINAKGSNRTYVPVGNSISAWGNIRNRLAINNTLQWQANDDLLIDFDLLLGTLKNDRTHYQLATAGDNSLIGNVVGKQLLTNAVIENNYLVFAQFKHLDLRSEHQKQQTQTNYYQASMRANIKVTDSLSSQLLIGRSDADFSVPLNHKIFLQASDHNVSLDWRNRQYAKYNYDFDLTSSEEWQLMRTDVRDDAFNNTFDNIKNNFTYALSSTQYLDFGVHYKRYLSAGWERRSRVDWQNKTVQPLNASTLTKLPLSQAYSVGQHDITFADIMSKKLQPLTLTQAHNRPGTVYQITEKTWASYLQYRTQGEVFKVPFNSNVGVRWFKTAQASQGDLNIINNGINKQTYEGWLPTSNLNLELDEHWQLRLAASKNIARADLNQLRPYTDINVADLIIKQGNPRLKPFRVKAVDLSLEYYSNSTTWSAASFYKSLNGYIVEQSNNAIYADTKLPLAYLDQDSRRSPHSEFTIVKPINSNGAYIYGLELAMKHQFSSPFESVEMNVNISLGNGKAHLLKNQKKANIILPGLSKQVFNTVLQYNDTNFGVALSSTYRSKYITSIGETQNTREGFDASIFYDLDGYIQLNDRSKIVFGIKNIGNEALRQFQGERTLVHTQSGTQFSLGVHYALN